MGEADPGMIRPASWVSFLTRLAGVAVIDAAGVLVATE
jgi:hypothetical protein